MLIELEEGVTYAGGKLRHVDILRITSKEQISGGARRPDTRNPTTPTRTNYNKARRTSKQPTYKIRNIKLVGPFLKKKK